MVNKLALSGVGVFPLLFALVREAAAAPILFALLFIARSGAGDEHAVSGMQTSFIGSCSAAEQHPTAVGAPAPAMVLRLLPGVCIFVDQLCSLVGVSLADPLSAAAWQPSQVVFTILICSCLGMEVLTARRALAAALTVAGALSLVLLADHGKQVGGANPRIGQYFFFANCLASSLEVILWRKLLTHARDPMAHIAVMAESYLIAAALMACACVATSFSPALVDFLCPTCSGSVWQLKPQALWGVGYSVIFQTVLGYAAQAWALRKADASLASLYATAQPVIAAGLVCALLLCGFNPGGVLRWPGPELGGALLIIMGLLVAQGGSAARPREAEPP